MGNVFSDADEPAATPSVNDTNVDCRQFLKDGSGRVTEHFERVRDLGEGAYGEVFLARQRVAAGTAEEHSGRLVAVKRVRKPNPGVGLDEEGADSQQSLEEFRLEVDLMKSLDHPCICRLLQVYEDPKNLYIVMEHIEGGELFEHVVEQGNFSEHDAARVIRQVSSSLEYCHDRGVVHRDIKPENIMVVSDDADSDEVTVKLIDFGFGSRILSGVKLKARVGTFVYTAPEAFKDEPCDEKLDMWALGCVLFVLLSGDAPFFGADCQSKIIQGSFSMEGWDAVSDSAKDLIRGLLEVDPSKRLSAAEVLQHAWLQKAAPHLKASANSLDQMHALEAFHKQSLFRHLAAGVLPSNLTNGCCMTYTAPSAVSTKMRMESSLLESSSRYFAISTSVLIATRIWSLVLAKLRTFFIQLIWMDVDLSITLNLLLHAWIEKLKMKRAFVGQHSRYSTKMEADW